MHHLRFLIVLLALSLIVGACAHTHRAAPERVPLFVIRHGQQMLEMSGALGGVWITDEGRLAELMDRVEGGTKVPSEPTPLPEIDFADFGVLAVWMGERPSGGYSLELVEDTAEVEDRTARVSVRWIEPEEGLATIQVITNPYLMLRLGKGSYDRVAVLDQDGVVRVLVEAGEK